MSRTSLFFTRRILTRQTSRANLVYLWRSLGNYNDLVLLYMPELKVLIWWDWLHAQDECRAKSHGLFRCCIWSLVRSSCLRTILLYQSLGQEYSWSLSLSFIESGYPNGYSSAKSVYRKLLFITCTTSCLYTLTRAGKVPFSAGEVSQTRLIKQSPQKQYLSRCGSTASSSKLAFRNKLNFSTFRCKSFLLRGSLDLRAAPSRCFCNGTLNQQSTTSCNHPWRCYHRWIV